MVQNWDADGYLSPSQVFLPQINLREVKRSLSVKKSDKGIFWENLRD